MIGWVPWQIRDFVARVAGSGKRRALASRRSEIALAGWGDGGPVLGFGGILDGGRFIHGGAVKLLALKRAFPSDDRRFDILYAVSSASPEDAVGLARICKERGARIVWNQNGVGYPGWAGSEHERHNAPMRAMRAVADYVVYQSRFCQTCAERFLGPSRTPAQVLLNPVDLEKFSPSDPLPSRPLKLLAMGTQNYPERVFAVIDALAAIRAGGIEATLTVAGNLIWKNAATEVAARAEKAGVAEHCAFRAAFTQEDAPSIYRGHHILLHPKYKDPCPTVVAEALACGLPVVASRSGGVPEMTSADCSRLIEVPETWDALPTPSGHEIAAAAAELARDLAGASRAARNTAESLFDARAWIATHREIFSSLRPA